MASIAGLRKEAKELGIPFSQLRGLTTEDEIQAVIDAHTGKSKTRVVKKKTVVKKKNSGRKSTSTRKSAERKSAPAKSTGKSGTAKRQTTAKKATRKATKESDSGRNLLEDVDFTVTEGWNPREDSAPDRIVRALRKHRGNRAKAFDTLVGDLWDFVSKKNSKGEKRSKAEGEWQLRYRISRTAWDFAKRTGQHEPSGNRAVYGEGGTGIGVSGGMPVDLRPDNFKPKPVFKRGKKASRKTTTATRTPKKASAKRGATSKRTTAKRGAKRKTVARRK
jgi:hypothetical protein